MKETSQEVGQPGPKGKGEQTTDLGKPKRSLGLGGWGRTVQALKAEGNPPVKRNQSDSEL